MTKFSGTLDDPGVNVNTILLELENKLMFISGYGIYTFITKSKIVDYLSIMASNLLAYRIAIRGDISYFFYNHFNLSKAETSKKAPCENDS